MDLKRFESVIFGVHHICRLAYSKIKNPAFTSRILSVSYARRRYTRPYRLRMHIIRIIIPQGMVTIGAYVVVRFIGRKNLFRCCKYRDFSVVALLYADFFSIEFVYSGDRRSSGRKIRLSRPKTRKRKHRSPEDCGVLRFRFRKIQSPSIRSMPRRVAAPRNNVRQMNCNSFCDAFPWRISRRIVSSLSANVAASTSGRKKPF